MCLISAGAASSPVANPVYLKVIKEGIVREGPAPYYKVAETLPPPTVLKAVDKTGEWFLVKTPGGRIGWINAEAVIPIDEPAGNPEAAEPKPSDNNGNVKVQLRLSDELEVATNGFLMAGPGASEKIISNLNAGLRVKKLETAGDWYKIELPIGLVGWAHCTLFPEIKPETPIEPAVLHTKLIKNGNLRQNPTRNAAVLATLPAGTAVTLIDSTVNWYKITTADGQTGWMNYLLFPGKSPQKPSAKTELKKTLARNGNLRESPALNAPVIKVIPARTTVTVLDSIPDWYKVQMPDPSGAGHSNGQATGWINTKIFR